MTLEKPHGLNWNAAGLDLPEMPMVSPGADAMSMTIAGVLPTLAAELTASVAALNVKENMFSGKLTTAESQYTNADESGGQSVGQLTSMLGEVGKMAQSAGQGGGGAGGGSGIFSSLIEQAMKMAEGMGGSQEDPAAQAVAPQAPSGGAQHQPSSDAKQSDQSHRPEVHRDARPPAATAPGEAAPGETRRGAGPVPITQHEPAHRRGDDDLEGRT